MLVVETDIHRDWPRWAVMIRFPVQQKVELSHDYTTFDSWAIDFMRY